MKQIITHFTDNDLYTFSCQYYIMQQYPRAEVEYTFYDRNKTCYPQGFDKLLQEQVDYMAGVVITDEEISFKNSLITVNEQDKTWKYTPEYYELKHLSHYVQPGAKRLLLDGSTYEDMLGFVNPDGTVALVMANQTGEPQALSIRINGKSINICLGQETFHSILLSEED